MNSALANSTFENPVIFAMDPRSQGMGLEDIESLDAYGNKFFSLADIDDKFFSTASIPEELHEYYASIGYPVPDAAATAVFKSRDSTKGLSLERAFDHERAHKKPQSNKNATLMPYMPSETTTKNAGSLGLQHLGDHFQARHLADKHQFQRLLVQHAQELNSILGFTVCVPHESGHPDSEQDALDLYNEISRAEQLPVVLIKPKSASALGISIIDPQIGASKFIELWTQGFEPGEEVLVEQYIEHNQTLSVQGFANPDVGYAHEYIGVQIIERSGLKVDYAASEIRTMEASSLSAEAHEQLIATSMALGKIAFQEVGFSGIIGFDILAQTKAGSISDLVVLEANTHLPSSFAPYAATRKLFGDSFRGIVHNYNLNLSNLSPAEFLATNPPRLIRSSGQYGVIPLNLSYDNSIDLVVFARDQDELDSTLMELAAHEETSHSNNRI